MNLNYDVNLLEIKSLSIQKRFLKMYFDANAGHIGSSLSCVDILTFVFFKLFNIQDEFILSKGHAAASLYSSLCEYGLIEEEQLDTFYKNNTYFSAHPPPNKLPKIPFATGSLGHGLSLSAGLSFGFKLSKLKNKVFCVTSDGELNEGSTWEAALFIQQHKLTNLLWFIDRNKLQGFGKTEEILGLDLLKDKLASFGFDVYEVDGHNFKEFLELPVDFSKYKKPVVIICNTIKGKGWLNLENTVASHYLPLEKEEYKYFIERIDGEIEELKSMINEK
jgi:transketolase